MEHKDTMKLVELKVVKFTTVMWSVASDGSAVHSGPNIAVSDQ